MPTQVKYLEDWNDPMSIVGQLTSKQKSVYKLMNTQNNMESLLKVALPKIQSLLTQNAANPILDYSEVAVVKGLHHTSQLGDSSSIHVTLKFLRGNNKKSTVTLHLSLWLGLGSELMYQKGEFSVKDLRYVSFHAAGELKKLEFA